MINLKALVQSVIGSTSAEQEEAWEVITRASDGQTLHGVVDHKAVARFLERDLQPVICRLDWQGEGDASMLINRVQKVEDQIIRLIRGRGEYLGRLGFAGRHEMFVTVHREDDDMSRHLRDTAAAAGFALDWQPSSFSPRGFVAAILPDPAEKRRLADLMVVHELMRLNDDLAQVRPVEHRIYFRSRPKAVAFAERARASGYAPDPVFADGDEFCQILRHDSAMTEKTICAHTIPLSALAAEMGGNYNGWETETRPMERSGIR